MGRPTIGGGKRPTLSGGKVTGTALTTWSGTPDQTKFLEAVLKAAIKSRVAQKKPLFRSLKKGQLKAVSNSAVLVAADAAEPAGKFLAAAKAALKVARAGAQSRKDAAAKKMAAKSAKPTVDKNDEDILNTLDVKISGYRSVEDEERLWKKYFPGYYKRTSKDRSAFKDPHGREAVTKMVRFISGKKAPPGFSKHTKGVSIDFYQKRKIGRSEKWVDNSSVNGLEPGQLKWWYGTWLYSWLHSNAGKHGFKELATEAWHYDYIGEKVAAPKAT